MKLYSLQLQSIRMELVNHINASKIRTIIKCLLAESSVCSSIASFIEEQYFLVLHRDTCLCDRFLLRHSDFFFFFLKQEIVISCSDNTVICSESCDLWTKSFGEETRNVLSFWPGLFYLNQADLNQ